MNINHSSMNLASNSPPPSSSSHPSNSTPDLSLSQNRPFIKPEEGNFGFYREPQHHEGLHFSYPQYGLSAPANSASGAHFVPDSMGSLALHPTAAPNLSGLSVPTPQEFMMHGQQSKSGLQTQHLNFYPANSAINHLPPTHASMPQGGRSDAVRQSQSQSQISFIYGNNSDTSFIPISARMGPPSMHVSSQSRDTDVPNAMQHPVGFVGEEGSQYSSLISEEAKYYESTDAIAPEQGSRKRLRMDSSDESEHQLKSLGMKASEFTLEELALKVKILDSNTPSTQTDLAIDALFNPKDTKHDKHHQVFALAWLNKHCESSPTAVVPRNRIYARYVQLCSDFTLNPLMPANFGRLVRLLFPNLKTRRLGMRGKSKYHYCGIKLSNESFQIGSPNSTYSPAVMDSPQSIAFHTPAHSESPNIAQALSTPVSSVPAHENFVENKFKYLPDIYNLIERSVTDDSMNRPLSLPSIQSCLSKDYDLDYDIADTLQALQRIHCTTIFESMRFMQVDKLFSALTPAPPILTPPILKLLSSDFISEWMKRCDLLMYRSMIKMLTRLHLQKVPKEIMVSLQEISANYVKKLFTAIENKFPRFLVDLKLKLARQFIQLLNRLIRCIKTGSNASKVLANASERNAMLADWMSLNIQDIVMREVPCAKENSDFIVELLETNLSRLLKSAPNEENILVQYSNFLFEVPAFFPKVNPWLFSLIASNLSTTFIREMSLSGSRSFRSWWIVRCWIDEYISWSFELGGFLSGEFQSANPSSYEPIEVEHSFGANTSSNTDVRDKSAILVDLLDGFHGDFESISR